MITETDLNTAIAECQGKRNPDAKTCMMLAAFYTIKREMFGEEKHAESLSYSYAPAPVAVIETDRDSDFARVIDGKDQEEVIPVLDELMQTLSVIQPKLYDAVMTKLA